MPAKIRADIRRHNSARGQKRQKCMSLSWQLARTLTSKPDVDEPPFAEAPPVTLQIAAKVQLRPVGSHRRGRQLTIAEGDFHLEGGDHRPVEALTIQAA